MSLGKYFMKMQKHEIYYYDNQNSVFDDWLTLYFAEEIYSIYSTFSYSTLLEFLNDFKLHSSLFGPEASIKL